MNDIIASLPYLAIGGAIVGLPIWFLTRNRRVTLERELKQRDTAIEAAIRALAPIGPDSTLAGIRLPIAKAQAALLTARSS